MMVEHIDDTKEKYKKRLIYFSKFYYKLAKRELPEFMNRSSDIQDDIYNLVLTNNSELEGLIRDIQEEELNGDISESTT